MNRKPRVEAAPQPAVDQTTAAAMSSAATPPDSGGAASRSDIFEIIRQRQMAQYERRQAFYQSFLPMR